MTIRSARRAAFATITALTALAIAVTPAPAFAKPKKSTGAASHTPARKKSIALGPIEGKKTAEVRGWVRDVLQDNFEFTDAEDFKPKGDDAGYMKMANDLGVEAVVVGKADKTHLVLTVRDGADGKVVTKIDLKAPPGPKLKALINKRLAPKLYDAFGMESPAEIAKKNAEAKQEAEEASAEEEAGDAEEAENETPEDGNAEEASEEDAAGDKGEAPAKTGGNSTTTPFEFSLGLGLSKRAFTFNDTLSQVLPNRPLRRPLRDYKSGVDFSLLLRAELYPGGLAGAQGFASNVGIIGGFEYGIPSKIVYKPTMGPQTELKNSVQDWFLGLKARVPLSANATLGFSWVYGAQKYYVKGDELNALVPDVIYSHTGPIIDARVALGRLFVQARVGARLVLDAGELEEPQLWFKNVGGRALEGSLTLGYDITPSIFVFAGGRFLRYGFDFNPHAEDARWVAGGATDQFMQGSFGVGYHLPGTAAAPAE